MFKHRKFSEIDPKSFEFQTKVFPMLNGGKKLKRSKLAKNAIFDAKTFFFVIQKKVGPKKADLP